MNKYLAKRTELAQQLKKEFNKSDYEIFTEMEIANELGIENNINGSDKSSYENGKKGGYLGGLMSKQLVDMGKDELIRQYYKNK